MDGQAFDRFARGLAGRLSRRQVVGGMAGGAAALLGVRASGVDAAPPRVGVCHATGNANHPWEQVTVSQSAANRMVSKGDILFIDCCPGDSCPNFYDSCGGGGTPGACGCDGVPYEWYAANTSNGDGNSFGWWIPDGLKQTCIIGPGSTTSSETCPLVGICEYTFWAYSDINNSSSMGIVAYDGAGNALGTLWRPGDRYVYAIDIDYANSQVIFYGQSSSVSATFAELYALIGM